MNADLIKIKERFLNIMKNTEGIIGAWNFGSAAREMSDEYSDADIVFLISGNKFKHIQDNLESLVSQVCDDILLCFEEEFNGESIINNGYLIKNDENVFQFDVFLLNNNKKNDFMCKIHYTDISENDILFDPKGYVKELCENCPKGSFWNSNVNQLFKRYLYHFYMSAKYLVRKDYFKLNYIMKTLFETHASLLLTLYDSIKWGGEGKKLNFIPEDKQQHLKKYFCSEDFNVNKANLLAGIEYFKADIEAEALNICTSYRTDNMDKIKMYWLNITKDI